MENLYEMIKALEARVEELESAKRFVTTASEEPHLGDNGNDPNRLAFMKGEFLPDLPKLFPVRLEDLYDPTFSDGLSPSEHLDRLYGHRAASPQPAEDPTDDELLRTYGAAKRNHQYDGPNDDWPNRAERAATVLGLRAVLARYGRPALEPTPVSDRLPNASDCCGNPRNGEGRWCWGRERQWHPSGTPVIWRLMRVDRLIEEAVDWLPWWALPLPPSHSPDATKMAGEGQP
jgi:hypothetical protein